MVENKITETILSQSESDTPGLRLKFLESRKRSLGEGDWIEYFVLYKMKKWVDTAGYLEYVFSCLSKLIGKLKELPCDSLGLQEVDCSEPGSYYVLIYILSDGRNKSNEEKYECSEFDGQGDW